MLGSWTNIVLSFWISTSRNKVEHDLDSIAPEKRLRHSEDKAQLENILDIGLSIDSIQIEQ
jgi:hypothetical protein